MPGKPGAVATSYPSEIGGAVGNHHIRQAMFFVDVPLMQQPEAYLGGAWNFWKVDGVTVVTGTEGILQKFIDAYEVWVKKF